MKIAVNLLFDGEQTTGAGLYGYRLAEHLALLYPEHEIIACLHPANAAKLRGRQPNLRVLHGYFPLRRRWARRLWEQLVLPLQLLLWRVDLVHSVDNTALLASPCPQVVSILDLLFLRHPRQRFEGRKRLWYQVMVPLSLRRARRAITLSRATDGDLHRLLRVDRTGTAVHVIPPGIDPPHPRGEAGMDGAGGYILAVGTQEPLKDHATLLRAYALLRERLPGVPPLVVAGREERATAGLHALREHLGLAESVTFRGYVPPPTLAALYAGAALFVFPSLGEGFGLPPLEALSYGVPVVATAAGPLPEILGDAAVLVPPGDAAAMAAAMERVLADGAVRAGLRQSGHVVVARYTWRRCAAETMAVYEHALGVPPARGDPEHDAISSPR